jgi:hypothetical protein
MSFFKLLIFLFSVETQFRIISIEIFVIETSLIGFFFPNQDQDQCQA